MQFLDTVGLSDSVILYCGLSDGGQLKNDIDKVVTVTSMGKVLRSMSCGLEPH